MPKINTGALASGLVLVLDELQSRTYMSLPLPDNSFMYIVHEHCTLYVQHKRALEVRTP